MSQVIYKRADSDIELHQILELQGENLPTVVSEAEKKQEGFVTVLHDFQILKTMNEKCPHVIAKSHNRVIGYTLCMLKDFKDDIEVLKPMFDKIENCLKNDETYITMGQVCVDKSFRRKGVFRGLYQFMKEVLQSNYDMIITEVDVKNQRSLNAHYAIGFKVLYSYRSNDQDWEILSWDIKNG